MVLGALVLLFLGGLLATVAALLPRFLLLWEGGFEAEQRSLEEMGVIPLGQTEMGIPRLTPGSERPMPPEPSPSLAPREMAAPDQSLVAAAIALALALYQGETVRTPEVPFAPQPASTWALAGRWQAMQARLNLPKR
jgi:hypothetical protein